MAQPTLARELRLVDAVALVVGCIIGAGIFRTAASVAGVLATPGLVLLIWAIGGLLSLCGALCYAELASAYPSTGGDYVYLTRAYGPLAGFCFGWTKVFIERTGTIAILAFVFAEYLGRVAGSGELARRVVATAAILLLTLSNTLGVRWGTRVQNALTALKVLTLGGLIAVGLFAGRGSVANLQPFWPSTVGFSTFSSLGVALVFVLWTYGGWSESAYVAEEVREPERNVPRSIVGGLLLTTALYLGVNAVYLAYVPLREMVGQPLVAATMMSRAIGPRAGTIMALLVAHSALGALNGYILTSARILLAVGQDHPLLARFGGVHPRFRTPARALLCNALLAAALVWTKTFDQIVTYSTVAITVFYAMACGAVMILRRREPQRARPYRVWGYPWTPWLFILTMAAFVADLCATQPAEALLGLGLAAAGALVYLAAGKCGILQAVAKDARA